MFDARFAMDPNNDARHAAPGPLVGGGSASSGSDDGRASEKAKVHQFNEQTNYVPKRTIITVGGHPSPPMLFVC